MNISSVLARIKTVEEGLSITSPQALSVRRVYKYTPREQDQPEALSWMHSYSLLSVSHMVTGLRKQIYQVRCQFWVGDPDIDGAADIASAFLAAWLDAFSLDLTLNGACSGPITITGADPTDALLTWGNLSSIGLDLAMLVPLGPEAVTVGP